MIAKKGSMKNLLFLIITLILPLAAVCQTQDTSLVATIPATTGTRSAIITDQARPQYCDDIPTDVLTVKGGSPPLPKFQSVPTMCYKVQVAILRSTDPFSYPFHEDLVARWRPCEQVWVVESKESYCDREEAERMRETFKKLGYTGAYITQLVSYQAPN